ncbi:NAD(P)H-binding protein [Pedobacter rhizosphaerae]|uniref:Uncharacterized conserved protein YbjT, contains NAD(P)-binding and DUF2867 domains n=1 Tax=Pedobacter rhizosphaerae TaxID=390241 RepID=A0A1H9PQQ8_9SPHI|nr:NAD(P)H-binding protein [Pedobacter rhizosphaerae]SER50534.1 Uncharacterized conserved protein YbjT, contains NAD(P)-binding and DUF2867 domains [Pedobacter rhizosphaerae]
MKAIIIGATGATGTDLVNLLLKDPRYTTIVTFVRRASGIAHPKLTEIITDFDQLEAVSSAIKGEVVFLCLGTTLKAAGSKEKQWQIDYEIPTKFAELAKVNGVGSAVLLSAYGASVNSKVFYSQVKGKLEERIESLTFHQYIIFRPGLLLRKGTDRWGERIAAGLLKALNSLGLIRKFKPLPTIILAEKMANAPDNFTSGKHIIELNKIFDC